MSNTTNSQPQPQRPSPASAQDFSVAIICALTLEADAVLALFDHHWNFNNLPFGKAAGDSNAYSTGAIGKHNVVLVHMPGMGKAYAATAAANCRASFPGVKLALVVGICGAVPFRPNGEEIILGDVVIGEALVQFDFGRQLPGRFTRKNTILDALGGPDPEIRAALAKLKGVENRKQLGLQMMSHLDQLRDEDDLATNYPGKEHDRLFEATYPHQVDQVPCQRLGCNGKLVARKRLEDGQTQLPIVHFGLIASGDMVMKSGEDRDRIALEENIIAFEMEGVGVQVNIPCIVIKGVCDYADSHKNKIWQRYAAATAATCMKSFLGNWMPSLLTPQDQRPSPAKESLGPWFIIPYNRNETFVGRNEILKKLQQKLSATSGSQRAALVGLGGIGKTQIALEHAYWVHKGNPEVSIFWVHASNAERFRQSYFAIAQECNIPDHDNPKVDILELVKSWLERTYKSRWLMVIDNADDKGLFSLQADEDGSISRQNEVVTRFIPDCPQGSILITTRNKHVGVLLTKNHTVIKVDRMDADESTRLVSSTLELEISTDEIMRLSSRLEHLPLALVQASAYIRMNDLSVKRYLQLLDRSDKIEMELLGKEFETVGRESGNVQAVASTWILSFKQIEEQNQLAIEFLSLMSFFDRQAIPAAFLSNYANREHSKTNNDIEMVEIQIEDALGILKAFSFISVESSDNLAMHRLVQLVTRKWLASKGQDKHFANHALRTASAVYPFGKFENREVCEAYLPHVYAVLNHEETPSRVEKEARQLLLHNAAQFLLYKGMWTEAEQFLLQATDPLEELGDADLKRQLPSISTLATIYWEKGHWKEAEALQLKVLELSKRVSGEDDPNTLISMCNLSLTYREQGRFAEAEELQCHVLKEQQRILGEEHPDTIVTINNLGLIYNAQGRIKESEQLKLKMLDIAKRILGPEHHDTLVGMCNLASLYWEQDRFSEAEALLTEVVEIRLRLLGKMHPSTLYTINGLASVYWGQKRREEAEQMQAEVFALTLQRLGEEHPDTLVTMTNLAVFRERMGKNEEALELQKRCLALREKVLGLDHAETKLNREYLEDMKLRMGIIPLV